MSIKRMTNDVMRCTSLVSTVSLNRVFNNHQYKTSAE